MSNAVVRKPGEGERVVVVGDVYTYKVTGAETGGRCMLMEAWVGPGGGPPPHVHTREDEWFWVLEGELTFYRGGQRTVLGPGGFVFLPRDEEHRFANEGTVPARALIQCVPAGLEEFFRRVSRPANSQPGPPTPSEVEHLVRTAREFGIELRVGH